MQSILLDILILGLLVLLFASLYRKNETARIRFWLVGWLFVLLHFTLLLFNPASALVSTLVIAASETALILCGSAFALSSRLVWHKGWDAAVPVLLLSADIVGRVVARPTEIQAGVLVAFVGGPFFIALVRRRRLAEV